MEMIIYILPHAFALFYFGSGVVIFFIRRARSLFRFFPAFAFIAIILTGLLPTPHAWSDVRSQWVPEAAILIILAVIAPISFLAAFRGHLLIEHVVGIAGLLLFTFATPLLIAGLYETAAFLNEVRQHQVLSP